VTTFTAVLKNSQNTKCDINIFVLQISFIVQTDTETCWDNDSHGEHSQARAE